MVQTWAGTSWLGLAVRFVPVSGVDKPWQGRAIHRNEHFACSGESQLPEAELQRFGSAWPGAGSLSFLFP